MNQHVGVVGWHVGGSCEEHVMFSDSFEGQNVLLYVILTNFKGHWRCLLFFIPSIPDNGAAQIVLDYDYFTV